MSDVSDEPDQEDPFDKAATMIEAASEGKVTLAQAREVFMEVAEFRPKGMSYHLDLDPGERAYSEAANALKMALDALEADQDTLARSYTNVARIKLEKAREA